jgi:hypothetical protein
VVLKGIPKGSNPSASDRSGYANTLDKTMSGTPETAATVLQDGGHDL